VRAANRDGADLRAVAIIDDQPIRRGAIEQVASATSGLTVVASVATVDALNLDVGSYDVVVLHVPVAHDELSLKTVTRLAEISRTLLFSAWDRSPGLLAAIRAGASGCITRQSDHAEVARAITVVAHGGFYLCESLVDLFQAELRRPVQTDPHGLAPREVETLRWIGRGLTHAQTASRMGLTTTTIDTYVKRIRGKLKVTSTVELTRVALELGHPSVDSHDETAA
jgi:DNA-binding NarL/FixJ family response regulator